MGGLFRGLGEACPFPKERGKKVGHPEASKKPRFPGFRSHLGTLALKTEDFSQKIGRFSKTEKWIY